jgi:hypothetical protein
MTVCRYDLEHVVGVAAVLLLSALAALLVILLTGCS